MGEQLSAALLGVLLNSDVWIGDDGEPLEYLPEREARIGGLVDELTAAVNRVTRPAECPSCHCLLIRTTPAGMGGVAMSEQMTREGRIERAIRQVAYQWSALGPTDVAYHWDQLADMLLNVLDAALLDTPE